MNKTRHLRKSLLAAAVLSACAGSAHAHSSVTLYGVLDQNIGWESNVLGKQRFSSASGGLSGSRWGLRGSEDLGGGLHAIFTLENGFDLGTGKMGQGSRMFGRQAFVGLTSTTLGSLTLGRQYDSLNDYVAPFSTGNQTGYGDHPLDIDNLGSTHRANNAIKFTSANYAGFTFGGTISPSGTPGGPAHDLVWSAGGRYANGPVALGVAYLHSKNVTDSPYDSVRDRVADHLLAATSGAVTKDATQTVDDIAGAVFDHYDVLAGGASYAIGPATLNAIYSDVKMSTKASDVGNERIPVVNLHAGVAEVNLRYRLTPALTTGVGYTYTRLKVLEYKSRIHQITFGSSYAFSKRTDVYAIAALQLSAAPMNAQIHGLKPSSDGKQSSIRLGMRHKF